jgi:phage FluMu protein Com
VSVLSRCPRCDTELQRASETVWFVMFVCPRCHATCIFPPQDEEKAKTRREWPNCLHCGKPLPREIKITGHHHESCPWNYYIECGECGYLNNVSKLLGFWAGCSEKCKEA